jgi:hypothetical protein
VRHTYGSGYFCICVSCKCCLWECRCAGIMYVDLETDRGRHEQWRKGAAALGLDGAQPPSGAAPGGSAAAVGHGYSCSVLTDQPYEAAGEGVREVAGPSSRGEGGAGEAWGEGGGNDSSSSSGRDVAVASESESGVGGGGGGVPGGAVGGAGRPPLEQDLGCEAWADGRRSVERGAGEWGESARGWEPAEGWEAGAGGEGVQGEAARRRGRGLPL